MTDGPYRHVRLPERWKHVLEAVPDAFSVDDCTRRIEHALMKDLATKELASVLGALRDLTSGQLELHPSDSIARMFESCVPDAMLARFEKEIYPRLAVGSSVDDAIQGAFTTTVDAEIRDAKSRVDDALTSAADKKKLGLEPLRQGLWKIEKAFGGLDPEALLTSVWRGERDAFRDKNRKQTGIDEGPSL